MAGDEISCEGCGRPFVPSPTRQGPRARYHSPACRKAASRRRRQHDLATEVADLGLSAGHGPLAEALAGLPRSALLRVRTILAWPSERIVSQDGGDGLCRGTTTVGGSVVDHLHNEEG